MLVVYTDDDEVKSFRLNSFKSMSNASITFLINIAVILYDMTEVTRPC